MKEIAGKQWKKEDELKGLKSELAALDRKIQLELAKDNEPQQQQAVANGEQMAQKSDSKSLQPIYILNYRTNSRQNVCNRYNDK